MSWTNCFVGDLCDSVSITYKGNAKEVVLINTSDVFNGKILNSVPVLNQDLKGQFKKTFRKDDILYSEIRPANKRFAFVNIEDTKDYIASTKLMVIRANKQRVRPKFLYILMTSQGVIDELQHLAESRSGTFPQITFGSEVAKLPVHLPDFKTQDAIISVVEMLNKKVSLNELINHNLAA